MRAARVLAACLGVAGLSFPLTAFAQQVPAAPAQAVPPAQSAPPSYARATGEETIRGRITSFDGKYHLQVRDERGFIDAVELRQGTVINPTGLTLRAGMSATILGHNRGRTFAANEIDTPYVAYGAVPAYPYPGGFGPQYSIGIGFGPVYFNHWH